MALTPTQMAAVRTAVDTKLAQLWSAIQSREDAYFAANGKYWQGLVSNSVVPADGATATPDVGSATPVGNQSPWPAGILSQSLPMALEIHEYKTPDGTAGYVALARVQLNGNVWEIAQQVGPESYRAHPWQQIAALS